MISNSISLVVLALFLKICLSVWLVNCKQDWAKLKPNICANDINYVFNEGNDKPVTVYYKLIITDLFDISEEKMEFGLQALVLEFWKDPHLNLNGTVTMEALPIPETVASCIWKPDLIFPNCKDSSLYSVSTDNIAFKYIPDDYIFRYSRYRLIVSCPMQFKTFPMDTQICPLNITLFSTFTVQLHWIGKTNDILTVLEPAITVLGSVHAQQFNMKFPLVKKDTVGIYSDIEVQFLVCEFTFERYITASLVNTYIPSFLVVSLSMVSFWLDVNAVPGRVTLGVTALLTLSTMIVHARSSLPSVNYLTAMDIWLFGCLVLVFLSLIEFTMAQAISRSAWMMSSLPARRVRAWPTITTTNIQVSLPVQSVDKVNRVTKVKRGSPFLETEKQETEKNVGKKETKEIKIEKDVFKKDNILDRGSRILFPSVMMFFVIIYWSFLLTYA